MPLSCGASCASGRMEPEIVEASLAQIAQELSRKGVDFSTPEAAEEALRRLQTDSSDFHRLPLVRELFSRLEAALRLQLPKKVNEEAASTGGQVVEGTAVHAASHLTNVAKVQAAELRLVGEVQSCVEGLQQREEPLGSSVDLGAYGNGSSQVMTMGDFMLSDSDDGSSDGSTAEGGNGGYRVDRMSKKVLATLQGLASNQEDAAKRAVAAIADKHVTADMVAESAKWGKVVEALGGALQSGFPAVRAATLSLLENLYSAIDDSPLQFADVFLVVAQHAATLSPELSLSDSSAGDIPEDEFLRPMRLVLDFLWDLPCNWTLYSPEVMQRIATATSLLLVGYPMRPGPEEVLVSLGDDTVCAFHMLAVLEPGMGWFRRWMGTARMGALLPPSMVDYGAIHHMLYLCMHVLQAQAEKASITDPAMSPSSPVNKGPLMGTVVGQAAANVLGSLIGSSSGRGIFPLKLSKKMKASMKGRKKEMNAGAIQSLIRILVPKAHPCPQPVVEAAFQQLVALGSRQSSSGSILMQHHVEALLEPLQAVLREVGVPLPASLRKTSGAFGGLDADSIATHKMVGTVLLALARLPSGRAVILSATVGAKGAPREHQEPSSSSPSSSKYSKELAGKFSAVGSERCRLFQLVSVLAKVCLADNGSSPDAQKLPLELLGAYLEVVGEMAMEGSTFWELMECGLVPTLCHAVVQKSSAKRVTKSEKDRTADRARACAVSMCAEALCRVATTPMGAQLVWNCGAIWATASHLTNKYMAATSTPEQRSEMLKQASGIALVAEGRDALVSSGLPRIVWRELTRELLGREDLGLLLQSDASAYPVLDSLRDLQGIMAWHGSARALLNEPLKIQAVSENQKVLKGIVDGILAGKDTYGNPHPEDVKQVGLQLLCMFRLDAEGLQLLTNDKKVHEILMQLIASQPREPLPQPPDTDAPPTNSGGNSSSSSSTAGKKLNKAPSGHLKHGKHKKSPQKPMNAGPSAPCPVPNEKWVLDSIVDMNTASAHALLEAHRALGGEAERCLVPYPCHIKAATWFQEHPELAIGVGSSSTQLPPGSLQQQQQQQQDQDQEQQSGVEAFLRDGPPAMDQATRWWQEVRVKLMDDLAAEALSFSDVGMLLQRTIMVAMNGRHRPSHHFFMISCSSATSWKPIRDIGSTSTDDGEPQLLLDGVTIQATAVRSLQRASVYLESAASGHLGTTRKDWSSEGLMELQKWAFVARHNCSTNKPPGFDGKMRSPDWFVSVVWSIMGPGKISEEFLVYLSRSPVAAYVWPAWGESVAGSLPAILVCHMVETIATEQMPGLAGAFAAASVSMSHIVMRWVSQEFVNYLSWEDIVRFVSLILVMGPDYIVYYMVALLRHLETSARRHAASADLVPWILQSQLGSFRLPQYLGYIQNLEAEYKAYVLPAMMINDIITSPPDDD